MNVKSIAAAALLIATVGAQAQFTSSGVSLLANIPLATFSASAGNDCWGYVSPSGREYALMGLDNKLAVVEITNPTSPQIIGTVPHTSSSWGDIKTYGTFAYVVTEAATGIQVVDLSQVDSGVVTLVRTIMSPSRSHNLQIDSTAGYLYTCGSNGGTGTTTCFSLANPSNPVQVGSNSLTGGSYQHDGVPVTYTSGPYAGRTLWFGFSETRGVQIWDFTNKSGTFLLTTLTYSNIGYCHQGWLTEDRKYLFVDDELDEQNTAANTRSLIFNVEDPANGFYVGAFSTGLPAIDHNQYIKDGFTFQANYRSGLRIFDIQNPTSPQVAGNFDTYPNSNAAQFNGAWSNYPFFPSGNVIVSDINRGLFVLDPTVALTRNRSAASYQVVAGEEQAGNLLAVQSSDNSYLQLGVRRAAGGGARDPIQTTFTAAAYDSSPLKLSIKVESAGVTAGYRQTIDLKNWITGNYETLDVRTLTASDTVATIAASGNLSRFVQPNTLNIEARLRWTPEESVKKQFVKVDQVAFLITR